MTAPPTHVVQGLLADGTRVFFRALRRDDRAGLADGFRRMGPESRYRRFFATIDHLSEEQLDRLTDVDYRNHFAWLAIASDVPGQPGIGVGRWVRTAEDPAIADAAVTVIDEYQHRGVGQALLRLMVHSAIERGIGAFRAEVLGDNEAMLALIRDVGASQGTWDDGVRVLLSPLPASIEELERTPSPAILRAAADGRLLGLAGTGGQGTRLQMEAPDAAR
ncbi:MAG: GNAT family N-acetyltransferase [Candidatus Dormibacteria bacterium]